METILMSGQERRRLEAMSRVKSGGLTLSKAAEHLGLSYRQVKRVWARYQAQGDRGLVHGLRGQASNRKSHENLREQVLARYRAVYSDYGPTLAQECLAKEGLNVPVSTLRRWLMAAGLWERRRRHKPHRRRRPRKEQFGELLQMDGSHHDWFEGRRGWAVLMVLIDDATGRVTAQFFENESWESATTAFWHYLSRHGLPRQLYVDRHSIYRVERELTSTEILAGIKPKTQFGRAMEELGVKLILAQSAGEGPRRADERDAARPAGKGVASGRDLGPGDGKPILGGEVPAGVQRTVRGAGGAGGRCASISPTRDGPGAGSLAARNTGGAERLDGPCASCVSAARPGERRAAA